MISAECAQVIFKVVAEADIALDQFIVEIAVVMLLPEQKLKLVTNLTHFDNVHDHGHIIDRIAQALSSGDLKAAWLEAIDRANVAKAFQILSVAFRGGRCGHSQRKC